MMFVAERREAAIFTFDHRDFRATTSDAGPWRLLVDEARYAEQTGRG
ncbi:MAG TPA: hypothetical protein VGA36_04195 [Nitriliruptorales bacterium]